MRVEGFKQGVGLSVFVYHSFVRLHEGEESGFRVRLGLLDVELRAWAGVRRFETLSKKR